MSLVVHDVMVSRWRERDTSRPSSPSRSSSHDTFAPSSEFSVTPVVVPPWIRRRPAILIRSKEAISFDRHYSPDFTSNSSSSSSSLDSSSDTSLSSPLDSLLDTSCVMHQVKLIRDHRLELHHLESSPDSSSKRSLDSSSLSAEPSHLYSPEDSRDEHIEIGAEAVVDFSIGDGVEAHNKDGIGMGVEKS
nr:hypothetical protein [Tanacetum cinerariifolium]